jgi:hypothetical protein
LRDFGLKGMGLFAHSGSTVKKIRKQERPTAWGVAGEFQEVKMTR